MSLRKMKTSASALRKNLDVMEQDHADFTNHKSSIAQLQQQKADSFGEEEPDYCASSLFNGRYDAEETSAANTQSKKPSDK